MSGRWGEFFDEAGDSEEVIPSEVVKFFIMQAMQQDPFTPPPPNSSGSSTEPGNIDITKETLGLETDDRVIHTIKLMQHAREMRQLIEAAVAQTELLADSQIPGLPAASDIPEHRTVSFSHTLSLPIQHMENKYSDFTLGKAKHLPEITPKTAKSLLHKYVAALLAHAGFETTTENVLAAIVNATETYITKMVSMMRVAVDMGENVGAAGFPDAMERVFTEMRIGSVRELHNYYNNNVVKVHERLQEECRNLNQEYCNLALNVKTDVLGLDDIPKLDETDDVPEFHCPAMTDDSVDQLQSHLGPGLQILHSLEQGDHLQGLDSQDGMTSDSPVHDTFDMQFSQRKKRV